MGGFHCYVHTDIDGEPVDSVNNILTLVLTSVAYKIVAADTLPPINYLTLLDYYILTSFATLAAILAEQCFSNADNNSTVRGWIVFGIWLCTQAYFGLRYCLNIKPFRENLKFHEDGVRKPLPTQDDFNKWLRGKTDDQGATNHETTYTDKVPTVPFCFRPEDKWPDLNAKIKELAGGESKVKFKPQTRASPKHQAQMQKDHKW